MIRAKWNPHDDETFEEYCKRRALDFPRPVPPSAEIREVTHIIERTVEVPVDRIVEKIVFRDPPEQSTLRKVGEGLEDVQAKLEARVRHDAVPVELQEHIQEGETVSEAKSRFLKLYSDLGNKVQMGIAKDFERRLHESLHAKMNWITGD